jgi:hypothetical protein
MFGVHIANDLVHSIKVEWTVTIRDWDGHAQYGPGCPLATTTASSATDKNGAVVTANASAATATTPFAAANGGSGVGMSRAGEYPSVGDGCTVTLQPGRGRVLFQDALAVLLRHAPACGGDRHGCFVTASATASAVGGPRGGGSRGARSFSAPPAHFAPPTIVDGGGGGGGGRGSGGSSGGAVITLAEAYFPEQLVSAPLKPATVVTHVGAFVPLTATILITIQADVVTPFVTLTTELPGRFSDNGVHLFGGEGGLVSLSFHVWESGGAQNTSSRSSPVQRLVDSLEVSCANNLGSCKGLVVY